MKYLISITLLFIILSCKKENSSLNYTHSLTGGVVEKMKIDNLTSYRSNQNHVYKKNGNTLVLRKNTFTNSILNLNWKEKTIKEEIRLKKEGPNEVIKFDSAAFLNLSGDTTFIGTGYSEIYLLNKDSVFFRENYSLNGKSFGNMMNGFNKNLPIKLNQDIWIFRKPPVARNDKNYYNFNLLNKFNYNKKKLTECSVRYPKEYVVGDCWGFPHLRQSFTFNKKKNMIFFSFPITPDIYGYNILTDSYTKIDKDCSSSYVKSISPFPNCDNTLVGNEYYYYVKKEARYESINYDAYRDVYYRIILLPNKDLDKNNSINISMSISIMTLDSEFNILNEIKLSGDLYDYEDFFIDEEGLWLSKNNPKNPNFDENYIAYELFTLLKK